MSRVESKVNNDMRSSLLGSNSISGLYKMRKLTSVRFRAITRSSGEILRCLGMMSAIKESDSRSEKRFPSQKNSLEFVK